MTLSGKKPDGTIVEADMVAKKPDGSIVDVEILAKYPDGHTEIVYRPKLIVDNFEDHDFAEYNLGGQTSVQSFSVGNDSSLAYEESGFAHAVYDSSAGGGSVWAYSTGSPPGERYPQPGDEIVTRAWFDTADALAEFSYGVQSEGSMLPHGYHARLGKGEIALRYTDSTETHYMSNTSVDMSALTGQWVTKRILWPEDPDARHRLELYDGAMNHVTTISGKPWETEDRYRDGGIGYRAGRTMSGALDARLDDTHIANA